MQILTHWIWDVRFCAPRKLLGKLMLFVLGSHFEWQEAKTPQVVGTLIFLLLRQNDSHLGNSLVLNAHCELKNICPSLA
jgi:hypothetical protein